MFKPISLNKIKIAAQKVALRIHPEEIILFGSYAYGKPTRDSDVDLLLVIKRDSKKDRLAALLKASQALEPRAFPIDILVRSHSQIKSRIAEGDFFLKEIVKNGRILYKQ